SRSVDPSSILRSEAQGASPAHSGCSGKLDIVKVISFSNSSIAHHRVMNHLELLKSGMFLVGGIDNFYPLMTTSVFLPASQQLHSPGPV
ncbi:MAG: hypothetical protein JXB30_19245, partial [Anaerolineae bacterium]|nr:hypothetical protein [Anaerolineae bacterium]